LTKELSWLIETDPNPNIPTISPGDTVKVSIKTKEGERVRTQIFDGIVIRVRKGKISASFTVRHVAYGIGVERTFFFNSPFLEKVEVVQQAKVRRARLYYLRGLSSKATRAKLKPRARV
jgi:large subunit ribosomal protein L19